MTISRRGFVKAAGLGFTAMMMPGPLMRVAMAQTTPPKVLVMLFLRFGTDGLTHVVPRLDPWYDTIRPNIGLSDPMDPERTAISLSPSYILDQSAGVPSGFFEINANLQEMRDALFDTGRMAIVHAVGGSGSHSHFVAQDAVERAKPVDAFASHGWLQRAIAELSDPPTTLMGVALSPRPIESLHGTLTGRNVNFASIDQFALVGGFTAERDAVLRASYASLPTGAANAVSVTDIDRNAGNALFTAIDALGSVPASTYDYGDLLTAYGGNGRTFASRLGDAARLIKQSSLGVRAIAIDMPGSWDYHSKIVERTPFQASMLSKGLARFYADLDQAGLGDSVCTIVLSEFGRTAYENSFLGASTDPPGTDHGNGGVAYVIGGGVIGQRVLCRQAAGSTADCGWPGLGPGQLDVHGNTIIPFTNPSFPGQVYSAGERDLRDTIDFRDIYAEVLAATLGLDTAAIDRVLLGAVTGYTPTPLPDNGLFGTAVYS